MDKKCQFLSIHASYLPIQVLKNIFTPGGLHNYQDHRGKNVFWCFFLVVVITNSKNQVAAAPWARETNNVKKPQSQKRESCRKLDVRFFIKQNKHFMFQSHIWFWGLLLYSVDRLWCLESIHTLLLSRSIPLDLSRSTPFWVDPHPFEKKGVDWLKTSLTVHTVHKYLISFNIQTF